MYRTVSFIIDLEILALLKEFNFKCYLFFFTFIPDGFTNSTDDSMSGQFLSLPCVCGIFKEVLSELLVLSLIAKMREDCVNK